MREIELIVKECILDSIRESIPLEMILKTYMDETIEDHTEIKMKEEIVSQEQVAPTPVANANAGANVNANAGANVNANVNVNANTGAMAAAGIEPPASATDAFPSISLSSFSPSSSDSSTIKFNDVDSAIDVNNSQHSIHAPKTEERLEQISHERYMQRKLQEDAEDAEDAEEPERLKIGEDVQLDVFDVQPIEEPSRKLNFDAPDLDDIEILA
jgi:hypothetical protein